MKGHWPKTKALGVLLLLLSGSSTTLSSAELHRDLPPTTSSRTSSDQSRGRMSRCSNTAGGAGTAAAAAAELAPRGLHNSSSGGGALASILKLSYRERKPHGALQQQPQPEPSAGFLERLRARFGNDDTPSTTTMSTTTTATAGGGGAGATAVAAFLQQVTRLFRSELAQSSSAGVGAQLGRGSKIVAIVLGVACLLSVAAANTVVSRSSGWVGCWGRRGGESKLADCGIKSNTTALALTGNAADAVDDDKCSSTSRLLSLRRKVGRLGIGSREEDATGTGGRRRILRAPALLKAPRFPLAYVSWWKALRDRREVGGGGVVTDTDCLPTLLYEDDYAITTFTGRDRPRLRRNLGLQRLHHRVPCSLWSDSPDLSYR